MSKVYVNIDRCKHCRYCERHCPKKAISFSNFANASGYNYVVVDDSKCVGCGICYTVCPDGVFEIKKED